MKILNKTTGRFYISFASDTLTPIWSEAFRPSQAARVDRETAEQIVRQLTQREQSLDLQIVD